MSGFHAFYDVNKRNMKKLFLVTVFAILLINEASPQCTLFCALYTHCALSMIKNTFVFLPNSF
jgi:hypothetical protein